MDNKYVINVRYVVETVRTVITTTLVSINTYILTTNKI